MPAIPPTLRYATAPRPRPVPPTLIFAITANVSALLLALSWLQYAAGSPMSDTGVTDIYALLLAAASLLLIPVAVYHLFRRQFLLAILTTTLGLSPLPIYIAITEVIWLLKGFHLH